MPIHINFVGSSLNECMLRRGFLLNTKNEYSSSGKCESVSKLRSMKIDEPWECLTLYATKKRHAPRGKRVDTCDHTACPEAR